MASKKETNKKETKGMLLTNQAIFASREPLGKLMEQRFHIRVSYNLAKLASQLQGQLKIIEDCRNGIIKKYGVADPNNPQQTSVPTIIEKLDSKGKPVMKDDGSPEMIANPDFGSFVDELTELMAKEEAIDFGKVDVPVKLPEMVASTCDKCHNNMDRALEIEPGVLLLLDKLVEVAEPKK